MGGNFVYSEKSHQCVIIEVLILSYIHNCNFWKLCLHRIPSFRGRWAAACARLIVRLLLASTRSLEGASGPWVSF